MAAISSLQIVLVMTWLLKLEIFCVKNQTIIRILFDHTLFFRCESQSLSYFVMQPIVFELPPFQSVPCELCKTLSNSHGLRAYRQIIILNLLISGCFKISIDIKAGLWGKLRITFIQTSWIIHIDRSCKACKKWKETVCKPKLYFLMDTSKFSTSTWMLLSC